ncbi:MAG TPA: 3-phosphoshikimate 1-carboxyvinyltransferase [Lentisphaeria bacterium]|nr:MAG: 3-phosphoshikimate 1-carboxyvinyltransferase [Lentisphaerae bacterium GWF2_49_21]HBC87201.1 3-phosphoshikimate 1-carboxyvinyltransferase [Lentisphaeria bacterium]
MNLEVKKSKIKGEISVPGSKSHTIRAVAIGAMADGISKIHRPLVSGDTLSSLNASAAFGAKIEKKENLWTIKGVSGKPKIKSGVIDVGNSGTSLRIFTGLASISATRADFDGDESLRTRHMVPVLSALAMLGAKTTSKDGKCPLSVQGPIKGGKAKVEGKSSQFVTAILLAVPLIEGDTELTVFNLNEKPYVELTLDWLNKQKIKFEHTEDLLKFKIRGGQAYKPFEMTIPADFSTATFPLVAAAITGGEVVIRNLDFNDRQGDKEVFKYLEKMGMDIKRSFDKTVVKCTGKLKGAELDLNSTPDALPALAVAGCFAEGTTKLLNVPQARIKETDRIASMTCELRKMGADVEELPDGMIIKGSKLHGAEVESYNDHRIAMALAIAGLNAEGTTIVKNAESAAVTYPDFISDFKNLGAKFQ